MRCACRAKRGKRTHPNGSTVVSEYLALQVVGPKDMKKQKVVGPAKMVSAITRLGKVRLT